MREWLIFFFIQLNAEDVPAQLDISNGYESGNVTRLSQAGPKVLSFTSNAAMLAAATSPAVGIEAERKFLLKELSTYQFACWIPLRPGAVGIVGNYSGNLWLNTSRIGIAYGRALGEKVQVGLQFNYNSLKAGDIYGSASVLTCDASAIIKLTQQLRSAFKVSSMSAFNSVKNEPAPLNIDWALAYDLSDKFFAGLLFQKKVGIPFTVAFGFRYRMIPLLFVSTNIESSMQAISVNVGLQRGPMCFEIGSHWQSQLGFSPNMSMIYSIRKGAKKE